MQNARKISDHIEAGEVAAAILSSSGKIYTGVCIDTCCTLGICTERNAIFKLYEDFRGQGIGTALMEEMLALLRERGHKRASLSVQKANAAYRLYLRVGFTVVDENEEEYIMENGLILKEIIGMRKHIIVYQSIIYI